VAAHPVALAGAGTHHEVGIAGNAALGDQAQRRLGRVAGGQRRVLGGRQGVKRVHPRRGQTPPKAATHPSGHPVMGVQHLQLVGRRVLGQAEGEGAQVAGQVVLGRLRRTRREMMHAIAPLRGELAAGGVELVGASEHLHLHAPAGQAPRQGVEGDVEPAPVTRAGLGQRAGVGRDQPDAGWLGRIKRACRHLGAVDRQRRPPWPGMVVVRGSVRLKVRPPVRTGHSAAW
jgi:hypothetical protein